MEICTNAQLTTVGDVVKFIQIIKCIWDLDIYLVTVHEICMCYS